MRYCITKYYRPPRVTATLRQYKSDNKFRELLKVCEKDIFYVIEIDKKMFSFMKKLVVEEYENSIMFVGKIDDKKNLA